MSGSLQSLNRLMETLAERAEKMPAGSYTTKLMAGGAEKIGSKIREEAEELIEAAMDWKAKVESGDDSGREHAAADPPNSGTQREHFIYEAGDLLYHTMVMLAFKGVSLDEVAAELARREGTSGLVEKANRTK